MSSDREAMSEQLSSVHEGVGYDEVYPSRCELVQDLTWFPKREPFAHSPVEEEEEKEYEEGGEEDEEEREEEDDKDESEEEGDDDEVEHREGDGVVGQVDIWQRSQALHPSFDMEGDRFLPNHGSKCFQQTL